MKTSLQPILNGSYLDGTAPRGRRTWAMRFRLRLALMVVSLSHVLGAWTASAQIFVQEITAGDLVLGQQLGQSIGTNGALIAVGSTFDDTGGDNAGAVYVFNQATGAFIRKILPPPADRDQLDNFGAALGVAGNFLAVGAPVEESGGFRRGAVYLFNISTGVLLRTIRPTNVLANHDVFGSSVAISGDLLVIGAPDHDGPATESDAGAIYVFNLRTNVLSGPLFPSVVGFRARFGRSVAVLGDLIAVGAPFENDGGIDRGAVYLFDAQTFLEIHRFTAEDGGSPDGADDAHFGISVALGRQRLIVGAQGANGGTGKVYAYDTISLSDVWTDIGGATGDTHGISVAACDDLVVVGDNEFSATSDGGGRVQVFQARDGALLHTLTAPGPILGDLMGEVVSVSGSTVLVAARGRDTVEAKDNRGTVLKFSPVRSPLPFREIALKSSAPPGAANTTLSSFNQLAVSAGGFTTFDANVVGTGAALGKNSGIWTDGNTAAPHVLKNVRRTGLPLLDPAPSPPELQRKGADFTNPVSNIDGLLGFTATTFGTGITSANDKVFAVWDGSALRFPLQEGAIVQVSLLHTFQPPRQTSLTSDISEFAFNFVAPITFRLGNTTASSNDSGLVRFTATDEPEVLREGGFAPIAPANTVFYGQFLPRAALDSSRLTFAAFLQSFPPLVNNQAVFDYSHGGSPEEFVRKGDEAPGYEDDPVGIFSNFLAESNTSRITFIRAAITPPAGSLTKNEGIWSNRISGELHLALLKGDEKPAGLPKGVTIKKFLRFAGNKNGGILAWVLLQGTGVTAANDHAVILSRVADDEPNPVEFLLREGSCAPGCQRARIGVIQALDAETNGSYVVLVSLIVETGGASISDNQALFLGSTLNDGPDPGGDDDGPARRRPSLMLRKGMQFARSGSPIVKSISLPGFTADASGAMNTGLAHLVTLADADGGGPLGLLPTCSAVVTFNGGQSSVISVFP